MDKQTPMQPSLAKTILVVDDDPSMRLICVKTLRAEGFTVLEAEGSSKSLKVLATHQKPIDLLLTDLMLPPWALNDRNRKSASTSPWSRSHSTDPGYEKYVPRDPDVEPVGTGPQSLSNRHGSSTFSPETILL